jgi:hypothetical protein
MASTGFIGRRGHFQQATNHLSQQLLDKGSKQRLSIFHDVNDTKLSSNAAALLSN